VLAIIGAGDLGLGEKEPAFGGLDMMSELMRSVRWVRARETSMRATEGKNIPKQNIWIFDNLGQSIPAGMRSWKQLLEVGCDCHSFG
jgi:hypothetical protein